MAGAWVLQRRTGQSGWIDATWSFSVGVVGAILARAASTGARSVRQFLVAAAVLTASLRLGLHIARRSLNAPEDPRSRGVRAGMGRRLPATPLLVPANSSGLRSCRRRDDFSRGANPAPIGGLRDGLGALLLLIAMLGEGWADASLARFRAEPSNRRGVCEKGPWAWSRHPNYFFEWLSWLGYALLAVDVSGAWPQGWLAFCGPLLMYWPLAHVSGVPPLEKHMVASRGDAYRRYQTRVSAFFPWPPRKVREHVEESLR